MAGFAGPAAAISDAKRALIVELLDLAGGGDLTAQLGATFLEQLRGHYPALVAKVLSSEEDLTPEQREALARHLADYDRFAGTFAKRFPDSIDVDAIIQKVYVPLYDRSFEEEELREMIGFYRSPTGAR